MRSSSDCAWREPKPIRLPKNALAQAPRVRLVCCLTFTLLGGQCSIGDMNRARERNGNRLRCKIPTRNAKRRDFVWKYAELEMQPYSPEEVASAYAELETHTYEDAAMTPPESISNMTVESVVEIFLQIGMR